MVTTIDDIEFNPRQFPDLVTLGEPPLDMASRGVSARFLRYYGGLAVEWMRDDLRYPRTAGAHGWNRRHDDARRAMGHGGLVLRYDDRTEQWMLYSRRHSWFHETFDRYPSAEERRVALLLYRMGRRFLRRPQ